MLFCEFVEMQFPGAVKSRAKLAAARQNIKRASATLTPEQRIERAKKAAAARWGKKADLSIKHQR